MVLSELILFLSSYSRMSTVEKQAPETLVQIEKMKQIVEDNLSTNLFAIFGKGIQLGETCKDPAWLKRLAKMAEARAKDLNLSSEDQADLIPVIHKYLQA